MRHALQLSLFLLTILAFLLFFSLIASINRVAGEGMERSTGEPTFTLWP